MSKFSALSFFLFLTMFAIKTIASTPIGFWKTIDDVTGRPKAIIHITETTDNELSGKILKVFSHPGQEKLDRCKACEGDKHNQPIIGLAILENMKKNKNKENIWGDGHILDPKTGKIYHCTMQILEKGKKLIVRGYVGLPLFGRSQTWVRVAEPIKS